MGGHPSGSAHRPTTARSACAGSGTSSARRRAVSAVSNTPSSSAPGRGARRSAEWLPATSTSAAAPWRPCARPSSWGAQPTRTAAMALPHADSAMSVPRGPRNQWTARTGAVSAKPITRSQSPAPCAGLSPAAEGGQAVLAHDAVASAEPAAAEPAAADPAVAEPAASSLCATDAGRSTVGQPPPRLSDAEKTSSALTAHQTRRPSGASVRLTGDLRRERDSPARAAAGRAPRLPLPRPRRGRPRPRAAHRCGQSSRR